MTAAALHQHLVELCRAHGFELCPGADDLVTMDVERRRLLVPPSNDEACYIVWYFAALRKLGGFLASRRRNPPPSLTWEIVAECDWAMSHAIVPPYPHLEDGLLELLALDMAIRAGDSDGIKDLLGSDSLGEELEDAAFSKPTKEAS
ncbi:MAG: hypothetical protein ACYC3I_06545 [Gemmataceae bacterium]